MKKVLSPISETKMTVILEAADKYTELLPVKREREGGNLLNPPRKPALSVLLCVELQSRVKLSYSATRSSSSSSSLSQWARETRQVTSNNINIFSVWRDERRERREFVLLRR